MAETEKTLEEQMTPEERELFEKYRAKIGEPYTPPSDQEAMENEVCIYFFNQGRKLTGLLSEGGRQLTKTTMPSISMRSMRNSPVGKV